MRNENSAKLNRIAMILAVLAFVICISAVLVKYFKTGEIEIPFLAGGIVLPLLAIILIKLGKGK